MSLNNINVMGWTTNPRYLNHEREYAMGSKYILPIPLGRILPFVIPRRNSIGANIVRFTIYDKDEQAVDALSALQGSGLIVESVQGFDQIKFLGSTPLAGAWEPGCYRAVMSDGFTTWYSDYFTWTDDVESLVKVEWWHNTPLNVPGGVIQYGHPFKLQAYFKTDIAKPSYRFQEDVDRRESIDMPFLSISYKLYQFTVVAPEYLLDCLRLIPVHHNVEITHLGEVIEVDKITMGDAEWIERGDIAGATFTFRAGSTVATYGERAGVDVVGSTVECSPVDFVATRVVSSAEARFEERIASFVPNPPGYVMRSIPTITGVSNVAYLWYVPEPGVATQQDGTAMEVVFIQSSSTYYLWRSFGGVSAYVLPYIVDISDGPNYTITGHVPAGLTIEIWYRTENGSWQPHSTTTAAAINAGVDLGTDPSTWMEARLVLSSALCGELQTTSSYTLNQPNPVQLTGIGYQRIEATTTVG